MLPPVSTATRHASLQDEHLDVLPNGSHLSFGRYQEESRPLRRVLKQVGGGSIEGGILTMQQDQNALRELAAGLCIDAKVGSAYAHHNPFRNSKAALTTGQSYYV